MILTKKIKQVVKKAVSPDTRFMTLEGAAQIGKSNVAILAFGMRVAQSDANLHCIAAKDLDAIRDNILGDGYDNKFLDLFQGYAKLVGADIGSKYIEFRTSKGKKKILLAGYSNKKTWEKILGKPIENFFIDEINIADKTFLDETKARQLSFDNPFTICTLNGDDPDASVYDEFINDNIDLYPTHTPSSTIEYMKNYDKKDGRYYVFWRLDDHPLMTPEKKENYMNAYPVGSFYYTTKVLGERGIQEGLVYGHLIGNEHYIKLDQELLYKIKQLEIGIDIGDKALTVFTLTGYTHMFREAIVIDTFTLNEADYDTIINTFNNWLEDWYKIFGNKIKTIWPDAADSIFIRTLRIKLKYPVQVKASKKLTIKERVILKEQLIHQKRLLFNVDTGAKETALYLKKIKTDGKGGIVDENKPENDYNDALDYTLTPHKNKLSMYKEVNDGSFRQVGNKQIDKE